MTTEDCEPPEVGQSIFAADDPPQFNACVEYMRGDWLALALGYRELATRAWAHLREHGGFSDPEIHAWAFLWRHYLEVTLKAIVQACRIPESDEILCQHGLLPLWEAVKTVIQKQDWWSAARTDMERIEGVITDFHRLDGGSYDFRYPANRKRTSTSLQNAPEHINAARLNRWMIWVANGLEAIFDALTCGDGFVRTVDEDVCARRQRLLMKIRVKTEHREGS